MPALDTDLFARHFEELARATQEVPALPERTRGPNHRNPFYLAFRGFLRANNWRPSRHDGRLFIHPTMRADVPLANAVTLTRQFGHSKRYTWRTLECSS